MPCVNGIDEGTSIYYYKNGKIKQKTQWHNDKKNGSACLYYSDGHINETIEFKNDKRNGVDTVFYKNWQIKCECNYNNGLCDGYSVYYDKDGTLIQKVLYKKGNIIDFHNNNGIIGIKDLDAEKA